MFDEKHEERKKLIVDYLMEKQYLKQPPQFVFNELPNIWKLLDKNELIPNGMSYEEFTMIAQQACVHAQMGLY